MNLFNYNDYEIYLLYAGILSLILSIGAVIYGIRKKAYSIEKNISLVFYNTLITMFSLLFMNYFTFMSNMFPAYLTPFTEFWGIENTNFMAITGYLSYYLLLGWYFSNVIQYFDKSYIRVLSITLLAFSIYDYFWITGYNNYSSISQTVLVFYCCFLSLLLLRYVFRIFNKVPLNRNPHFWIGLGILIPNIGSTWLEFFGSWLYEKDYPIFCLVSIVSTILFNIGLFFICRGFYYGRNAQYIKIKHNSVP
jgi:hypothetical protein